MLYSTFTASLNILHDTPQHYITRYYIIARGIAIYNLSHSIYYRYVINKAYIRIIENIQHVICYVLSFIRCREREKECMLHAILRLFFIICQNMSYYTQYIFCNMFLILYVLQRQTCMCVYLYIYIYHM